MAAFTVLPAIDLRHGSVVRLAQGDPQHQTTYDRDAGQAASRWVAAGATWLHVVDLDAALGGSGNANRKALAAILGAKVPVQFGGGLRTLSEIDRLISLGVGRVILGTVAVEEPELLRKAISRFGSERVGVGIDVRNGRVRVRGWTDDSGLEPLGLARQLSRVGVRTVVYTDISRDGMGRGLNVEAARSLSEATGLQVIASGGVASVEDVSQARQAGLRGVIIGRALYEGQISLPEALQC